MPVQGGVRACSRSRAQQTATTAVGLELGSEDGLDGTIAFDGKQSRDEASKRDRFSMKAFVRALNRARLRSARPSPVTDADTRGPLRRRRIGTDPDSHAVSRALLSARSTCRHASADDRFHDRPGDAGALSFAASVHERRAGSARPSPTGMAGDRGHRTTAFVLRRACGVRAFRRRSSAQTQAASDDRSATNVIVGSAARRTSPLSPKQPTCAGNGDYALVPLRLAGN